MSVSRASGELSVPVAFCAPKDRQAVLWAAILASSMGFIDSSVTSIALPAMRSALGATLVQAQWMNASYLLALSALVLVGGAAGDRFGIARVFSIGIGLFVLGSLACAAAADPAQMIAARAAKGVGAALMVPGSMAMVARAWPGPDQGRALGLWAAASTLTTALGPVLGGIVVTFGGEHGWRLVFALNLPLGLVALWLIRHRTPGDLGRPGLPIDWIGAALASAGLGLFAWAMTDDTADAMIWALVLAILSGFVLWEARTRSPMINLALFRNRTLALTNLVTLSLYFALIGVMFYLPMTAISAWGISAFEVTAAFLPISLLIAALSAPAGRWADRWGTGALMATGSGLVALAYAGLWAFADGTDFWGRILPCMALAGVGLGLAVAPLTAAAMQGADETDKGAASGINNAVARVAGLMAVALLGRLAAASYGPRGPGFGTTGSDPQHLQATADAFGTIALIAALCAGIAAVIALAVPRPVR